MRKLLWGIVLWGGVYWATCTHKESMRLGTFNIEHFPKSEGQIQEVFSLIQAQRVQALAVQEILQPARFASEAKRRLGERWQFVYSEPLSRFHLGVLFDSGVFTLLSTRTYPELQVAEKTKPGFEARLSQKDGAVVRIIVVHFASTHQRRSIRALQYQALQKILAQARESQEELLVLGDFNATLPEDRADLEELARSQRLFWLTRGLPCTAYWPSKEGCKTSSLDHILSTRESELVEACGPCKEHGCEERARCPDFVYEVSDHCPVVASW